MAFTMPGGAKGLRLRDPRVLVVDDEPFVTHMLGGLLRKYGYIAAELNDPTKALAMAHRFQPDIVLLDIHMPWKDGHEVATKVALNRLATGQAIEGENTPALFYPVSIARHRRPRPDRFKKGNESRERSAFSPSKIGIWKKGIHSLWCVPL